MKISEAHVLKTMARKMPNYIQLGSVIFRHYARPDLFIQLWAMFFYLITIQAESWKQPTCNWNIYWWKILVPGETTARALISPSFWIWQLGKHRGGENERCQSVALRISSKSCLKEGRGLCCALDSKANRFWRESSGTLVNFICNFLKQQHLFLRRSQCPLQQILIFLLQRCIWLKNWQTGVTCAPLSILKHLFTFKSEVICSPWKALP